MDHLNYNFYQDRRFRNTTAEQMLELFNLALTHRNEEIMQALIFKGSPIISAELQGKDSYLHIYCCNCESLNIATVQLLIDCGINIDKQNLRGETALHVIAKSYKPIRPGDGRLDILKMLLQNGANREIRCNRGLTPIELSLLGRNLELAVEFLEEEDKILNMIEDDRTKKRRHLITCLLRERIDWNIPDIFTLLQFLILENDEEMFENVLMITKFDVNAFNLDHLTLLHVVATQGTPRMIKALVNAGADLEIQNKYKATPLIFAIRNAYNRNENIDCLIECGASINTCVKYDLEIEYPIHYAVCTQNLEMVEKLVKMGADVNALTFHRSPLLLACGSVCSKKWPELSNAGLVSLFDDDEYHFRSKDSFLWSVKIVEFLLDHGADLEAKNASNRTALDQACRLGKLDIVKLLLSRGAKINQGQEYVSTLHHAVRGKNTAIIKLILEKGANVNCRCEPEKIFCPSFGYDGHPPPRTPRTPLECALDLILKDADCKNIIELLMEYGVNLNVEGTIKCESPLHLAFLSKKPNIHYIIKSMSRPTTIKFLLRHNVNVNVLDNDGLAPLNYALRNYNLIKTRNSQGNYCNNFKPDLVALIAFIAKMIAAKEFVIEQNLILLEKEPAHSIYQECVKELSLMKNNICESRNISFLNILSKDVNFWGGPLKNEDILQVLDSGDYKKNFPIYSGFLEQRILESSIRQQLVELAIVLFHKHINEYMLPELLLKTFKYFNLVDFKNFAKACFVEVE